MTADDGWRHQRLRVYADRGSIADNTYLRYDASLGQWRPVDISDILTELKTVDGSGSGLDADTVDGLHASSFTQFPSTTSMLFFNSTAPTGWTKSTTHNDKAIRIVSGTPSSGGSSPFSTVFGKTATDGHTLTTAEIPPHNHATQDVPLAIAFAGAGAFGAAAGGSGTAFLSGYVTGLTGGNGSHTHPMDIRVQYVDAIICVKN